MPQDATKMLLGATHSSDKLGVSAYASDPDSFPAGTACRLGSDGLLTTTKGSNKWLGISLGRSLSDSKKTAVLRAGSSVPVLLTDLGVKASGAVTITNVSNLLTGTADTIEIAGTVFTAQSGAVVHGDATFRAATGVNQTATSLADQINNHADTMDLVTAVAASAVVTVTAKDYGLAGNALTFVYTDQGTSTIGATMNPSGGTLANGYEHFAYVALGQPVFIDDSTGLAIEDTSGDTESNAVYASLKLDGVAEADGSLVPVALVDMIGGL